MAGCLGRLCHLRKGRWSVQKEQGAAASRPHLEGSTGVSQGDHRGCSMRSSAARCRGKGSQGQPTADLGPPRHSSAPQQATVRMPRLV
jgi:hypothetical protein